MNLRLSLKFSVYILIKVHSATLENESARKKNTAERLGKSIIYIYLATYLVSFTAQKKKHEYYTDDFRDEKDSFIHRHFNVLPIICKLTGVG